MEDQVSVYKDKNTFLKKKKKKKETQNTIFMCVKVTKSIGNYSHFLFIKESIIYYIYQTN